jgi:hypothetical protein
MSTPSFTNLIRFLDENSVEWYGQVDLESLDNIEGSVVKVLGHDIEQLRDTSKTAVVKKASGIICLKMEFLTVLTGFSYWYPCRTCLILPVLG